MNVNIGKNIGKNIVNDKASPVCNEDAYRDKKAFELRETYNILNNLRTEANKMYDRSLQFISSGAIVISFTYLLQKDVELTILTAKFITVSWATLLFSIIYSLYGQYKSTTLLDNSMKLANLDYADAIDDLREGEAETLKKLKKTTEQDSVFVKVINGIQLGCTIIGIVALSCFIACDLFL